MWAWVEIAAGRADSTGGGGPLLRNGEGARGGRKERVEERLAGGPGTGTGRETRRGKET
jgi:hypothetical protein